MSRAFLVRAAALYLPLVAATILWLWRRPVRRDRGALLLAATWNLPALLVLHALAARFGWWRFEAEGGLFLGLPVDLYLGWAVLWGPVAALAFPGLPMPALLAAGAALDFVLMPAARPVVQLGHGWLLGELVGLLVALLPAQLLFRWTSEDRRLGERTALQVLVFVGLVLGILPAVISSQGGISLAALSARPRWITNALFQLLVLAAVPGLSAVQELNERGLGTPFPYDPPRRLVTTGVYAYVANPMQISTAVVLFVISGALASFWLVAAGLVTVVYSEGLAAWHENREIERRFGAAWLEYRRRVRHWLPRWRPSISVPARLYVAEGCASCSQLGHWLARRRPIELRLLAAEDHPKRDLSRITYEADDGGEAEGIAAVARALEHIHLGWAFAGWAIRLPIVRPILQAVMDVSGAGPRVFPRRSQRLCVRDLGR